MPVLDSGHKHAHHPDEIILVFFKHVQSLIDLISPEYILKLKVFNYLLILEEFLIFVIFQQSLDEPLKLGLCWVRLCHGGHRNDLFGNRLK